jgi:imidazoleglycerol-phosphate dehydratase
VQAVGDLHIDTHHTVEDVGIALGETFREALGDKAGVRRFASGLYPLDEALVEVVLDLSGRPYTVWQVRMPEVLPLGNPAFDPQLTEHFFHSFATAAGITLHVSLRHGTNVHHIIEASFKGLARCLRDAVRVEGRGVPSTKGVL